MEFFESDLDGEEWREIDYFPNYEFSNMGRVRTKGSSKIDSRGRLQINHSKLLKTGRGSTNGNAYSQARIVNKNGVRECYLVHRLIAIAFLGGEHKGMIVNHINGNKKDNRAENLEWCNYSENNFHAYKNSLKTDNIKVVAINSVNGELIDFYYSINDASINT